MQFATTLIALAGFAAAAPTAPTDTFAASSACPIIPTSFEISDFSFKGSPGPVVLEDYSFNVKGNVGPTDTQCSAVSGGSSEKCEVAFRDIDSTACKNKDFTWSWTGSDETFFALQINYTLPGCGTLVGCRRFDASEITCESARGIGGPGINHNNTVHFEDLNASSSFSIPAYWNQRCYFN